jgi:hypothetical protein
VTEPGAADQQPVPFPPTPAFPGQVPPTQPYPAQPYPVQPQGGQPYPTQPIPAQPYPRQAYPQQPHPGQQPYPTQPYPGQPYQGQGYPQQPYPGQPYPFPEYLGQTGAVPVPPKRRTGVIIAVAVSVVAVIVLAGLGVVVLPRLLGTSGDNSAQAAGTPSASVTSSPSSPTPFTGDLRDLLVPMPSGATTLDPHHVDGKVLSASEYAAIYKDKQSMMQRLDTFSFQGAAIRAWKGADSTVVEVIVAQFKDDLKANAFAAFFQFAYAGWPEKTADGFVDGIDLGRYFVYDKPDSYGNRAVRVVYAKNDMVTIIEVTRPTSPRLDSVTRLAQDQFARLP